MKLNKTQQRAYRKNKNVRVAVKHGQRTRKSGIVQRYTIALALDTVQMTATTGIAICSEQDNFSRAAGRSIAIDRAKRDQVTGALWGQADLGDVAGDHHNFDPDAAQWLHDELAWMLDHIEK